tara:strand:- start:23098 stop:23487 length:390 start_codon:yes stop_codon:yes gene_type:complete
MMTFSFCQTKFEGDPDRFKKGVFEIPATESFGKTTIIRKDSLQIESYNREVSITNDSITTTKSIEQIDTLYITWKNNFFYTLRMKSPKKEVDKQPIFVQITKVKDSSYEFSAKVGYSNFKQEGIAYKIK